MKATADRPKQDIPMSLERYTTPVIAYLRGCARYLYRHRVGTLLILAATILFFWPLIIRLDSYSPGGDAMFNAWEMSRNQHCILRQHCPTYADANIFYPHKDTMLYSETQLSAGIVAMPVHLLDQNPILQYNLLTIILFFLMGWCMYLLAMYLSRGNIPISVAAGLIFELAPFRMAAIWHLQNLSIFCLPLAVLLILKYFDTGRRKFLMYLFPTLLYVFFASWVQMVFMLIAIGILLLGMRISKIVSWRPVMKVAAVTAVAALITLPLALQYVHFSKTNNAKFSILDQEQYGSSLADYVIPYSGTLFGKVYHTVRPQAVNAYNSDSDSYHGLALYAVGAAVLFFAYRWRKSRDIETKRMNALILTLSAIALVGFFMSLGPFLKFKGSYVYPGLGGGIPATILMPYAIIDKLIPQLDFIRAVGRASVLCLFALCCFLAFLPIVMNKLALTVKRRNIILGVVFGLIVIELMPIHLIPMSTVPQAYNMHIPAVYKYVAAHKQIDNIAILQSNDDYPGSKSVFAWTENVLWSGYYNRNIFNGYSGYFPPKYLDEYIKMVDFHPSTSLPVMKQLGVKYVIVNKDLSGPTSRRPTMLPNLAKAFPTVYQDKHYALFRVVQ